MAISYIVYVKEEGNDWDYSNEVSVLYWYLYNLRPVITYEWRVDTYDEELRLTTTGDTWTFTTSRANRFPINRPFDYDGDKVFDPDVGEEGEWIANDGRGGGRYKSRIVVVGHKSIYFGDV